MSTIIESPPVKAKPSVDTDVLFSIRPELLNDSYIYVHCSVGRADQEMLIRIWRTTYLIAKGNTGKAELVHAENITYAPIWTIVPENFDYIFLLIFTGLPRSCKVFDLVEKINQPGNFYIPNIVRNESDVYHVNLNL